METTKKNPMQQVRVAKVVVNIAVGESGEKLEKAVGVLEEITGQKPCRRKAKKTVRDFGIRKGENIACMVTLRKEKAKTFLQKAFPIIDNKLKKESFDRNANISFGIKEHLYLPGIRYDPNVGILGMDVTIVFNKPGYRVNKRKLRKNKVGKKHQVKIEEVIEYLKNQFGVNVVEES